MSDELSSGTINAKQANKPTIPCSHLLPTHPSLQPDPQTPELALHIFSKQLLQVWLHRKPYVPMGHSRKDLHRTFKKCR